MQILVGFYSQQAVTFVVHEKHTDTDMGVAAQYSMCDTCDYQCYEFQPILDLFPKLWL